MNDHLPFDLLSLRVGFCIFCLLLLQVALKKKGLFLQPLILSLKLFMLRKIATAPCARCIKIVLSPCSNALCCCSSKASRYLLKWGHCLLFTNGFSLLISSLSICTKSLFTRYRCLSYTDCTTPCSCWVIGVGPRNRWLLR